MSGRVRLIVILLLATILVSLAFALRVKDRMIDFEVNYTAATRLRLGETLYRASDGHYQFKYMPFSAFLYLPLSLLPLQAAKAVWYGVVVGSTVLIFWISGRLIGRDGRKKFLLVVLPPLLMARFFLREVDLGQINALLTLILLGTIWLLSREDGSPKQEVGAGLLAGTATALKPYALIFLPYFVLRKKWLSLAASLMALLFSLAAPALFFGIRGNWLVLREWLTSLSASTPGLFTTQDNVSLMGFLVKWTGQPRLSLFLYITIGGSLGLFCLLFVVRGKSVARPVILDGFLLLGLIPLLSPLGWDYTFLAYTPAVMAILYFFDKFTRLWQIILGVDLALISLTFYDLLGRAAYATFMSWSVLTLCFLGLVGYLGSLRMKGLA